MIGRVGQQLLQSRAVQLSSTRSLYPYYHRTVVTPPRHRISYPEKVFWGLFLGVGLLATPAWILTHLQDYKGKK